MYISIILDIHILYLFPKICDLSGNSGSAAPFSMLLTYKWCVYYRLKDFKLTGMV